MPLYEFVCGGCNEEFEELVFRQDEEVVCPKCGGARVERKLPRFAFKSQGGRMRTASGGGAACSTCRPSPRGCSSCGI